MADEIDAGQEMDQFLTALAIHQASKDIPAGEAGECLGCGEFFTRTVGGYCGRCRDFYRLG